MKMIKVLIDSGHGSDTQENCSPDRMLFEWSWTREIAARLFAVLHDKGYNCSLVIPELYDVDLKERVRRINNHCRTYGAGNVVLVSIHVNAAGSGENWCNARGFSVFVSKNASSRSKDLSESFFSLAKERSMLGNRSIPKPDPEGRHFWTWSWTDKDIYILKQSACPAVLTENFFMDNKEDCSYLISEEGKDECVRLHADAITQYFESL